MRFTILRPVFFMENWLGMRQQIQDGASAPTSSAVEWFLIERSVQYGGRHQQISPHTVCEVGTCTVAAGFTEFVAVIPGNPDLRDERHRIDIVLCDRHETEFQANRLIGTVTAYGDQVAE